jgi:hypothetical protein
LPLYIPIILTYISTSCFHLFLGLLLSLVHSIVVAAICYGILWFFIPPAWSYHLSRRVLYKLYNICPLWYAFIPTFLLIFQRSASFTWPYIFLTIFLSNIFLTSLKSFRHHWGNKTKQTKKMADVCLRDVTVSRTKVANIWEISGYHSGADENSRPLVSDTVMTGK